MVFIHLMREGEHLLLQQIGNKVIQIVLIIGGRLGFFLMTLADAVELLFAIGKSKIARRGLLISEKGLIGFAG